MESKPQNKLLVATALLMVFGPIVWVSAAFFTMSRKSEAVNVRCNKNMEQLSDAFKAYAQEHGGKLPSTSNWVDELKPYLKDMSVLHCPADKKNGRSSYAMNSRLSGHRLPTGPAAAETVVLYETVNSGANPSGVGKDVMDIGRDTKGRHYHIANRYSYYLFADLQVRRAGTKEELKKLRWDVSS